MATCSHTYDLGPNQLNKPEYYVELTEKHLSDFEIWNSLCSNERYDMVLYLCEQYLNRKVLPVIPSEVITVLFTVASIGDYNKGTLIRKADPFDNGRESLSNRCLRLLETLVNALHEYDTSVYDLHDLELLRCQFFYFVDSIEPKNGRALILDPINDRNSSTTPRRPFKYLSPSFYDDSPLFAKPLYGSYINLIEDGNMVFKTPMLQLILSQEGSFWNSLCWALSAMHYNNNTSSSDDNVVNNSNSVNANCSNSNEQLARTWLLIFKLLFSIYDLRQGYFMDAKEVSTKHSPVYRLLLAVDKKKHLKGLLEYLFVGCVESPVLYPVCPLPDDNSGSNLYSCQFQVNEYLRMELSMCLRKDILCLFLKSIRSFENIPVSPPLTHELFYDAITDTLYNDLKIGNFKQFLITWDLEEDRDILATFIEKIINKAFSSVESKRKFKIVSKLSDVDAITNELTILLRGMGKFAAFNRSPNSKRRMQLDFCILLLGKLIVASHPSERFDRFHKFLFTIKSSGKSSVGLKDLTLIFKRYE